MGWWRNVWNAITAKENRDKRKRQQQVRDEISENTYKESFKQDPPPPPERKRRGKRDADLERQLFDDALERIGDPPSGDINDDRFVESLYSTAFFDWTMTPWERQIVYEGFHQYMIDTYDVDWDEFYDWETYNDQFHS